MFTHWHDVLPYWPNIVTILADREIVIIIIWYRFFLVNSYGPHHSLLVITIAASYRMTAELDNGCLVEQ